MLQNTVYSQHPKHRGVPANRQRGSVLVAVLAIILVITFMVTRFMEEAVNDLEYRAIFNEPADVRSFGYGMLEVALATVQEIALIDEGKLYAGEQGWSDPIAYAGIPIPEGWEVSIRIRDEGGKLPLNTMSEELLNKLLEETLDFDFGTARELSSTLVDWIDENDNRRLNGAESDEYLRNNPPYKAANRPLQSLEELSLLKVWEDEFFDEDGNPNELFTQLSGLVSVMNTGAVNLNAAPAEVLEVLALEGGWQDDTLFDGLEEPYLKKAPEGAGESSGVEISLLRVTVTLKRGDVPFVISALVEPTFSAESDSGSSGGGGGSALGSSAGDAPKTGSIEEQDAINFPFKILQLSEYTQGGQETPAARYSTMDIGEESASF
ncbi:MAG: type II secretory pathway component PulK [Lentimonas sp.]|jgi:type II secretory pathway component PulK